ncbi:hypothetical protein HDU76_010101, partial [Blyttiomyces sp. JEL0837]
SGVIPSNTAVVVSGGPVGATSNLPTPTLVGGGTGGNGNGGQGSGTGNGSTSGGSGNVNGNGSSPTSSSFPLVPVLGGVGGVVLIAGLVVGILVYRRRVSKNDRDGHEYNRNSAKVITYVQGPIALRQQTLNQDFKSHDDENESSRSPAWNQQTDRDTNTIARQQRHQQRQHIANVQPPPRQPHQYTPVIPGVITMGSTQMVPPSRGASSYVPNNSDTNNTAVRRDIDKIGSISSASSGGSSGNGRLFPQNIRPDNTFTVSNAVENMNGNGGSNSSRYAYSTNGYIEKVNSYPVDSKFTYNPNTSSTRTPLLSPNSLAIDDSVDDDGANVPPPSYPGIDWNGGNSRT